MIFLVQRSCESKGWKWLFLENIRIDKNIHHNQFSDQGPWLLWDVSVGDKGCSVLSANPNENVRVLRVWLDTGYYPELTNKCAGRLLIVWGLVAPPAQPSPALTHFDLVLLRPEGGCWLGWVVTGRWHLRCKYYLLCDHNLGPVTHRLTHDGATIYQ